jgi:hypothetical protein
MFMQYDTYKTPTISDNNLIFLISNPLNGTEIRESEAETSEPQEDLCLFDIFF